MNMKELLHSSWLGEDILKSLLGEWYEYETDVADEYDALQEEIDKRKNDDFEKRFPISEIASLVMRLESIEDTLDRVIEFLEEKRDAIAPMIRWIKENRRAARVKELEHYIEYAKGKEDVFTKEIAHRITPILEYIEG